MDDMLHGGRSLNPRGRSLWTGGFNPSRGCRLPRSRQWDALSQQSRLGLPSLLYQPSVSCLKTTNTIQPRGARPNGAQHRPKEVPPLSRLSILGQGATSIRMHLFRQLRNDQHQSNTNRMTTYRNTRMLLVLTMGAADVPLSCHALMIGNNPEPKEATID